MTVEVIPTQITDLPFMNGDVLFATNKYLRYWITK